MIAVIVQDAAGTVLASASGPEEVLLSVDRVYQPGDRILVSNGLTYEEGSLYSVMLSISVVWCVFLVFVGLMEIHDYGPGKTFIFIIVTILGAAVIIFLILVFFVL